jgi:hypothetical protein
MHPMVLGRNELGAFGRAARERVLRDHTREKRFTGLLQGMGILSDTKGHREALIDGSPKQAHAV